MMHHRYYLPRVLQDAHRPRRRRLRLPAAPLQGSSRERVRLLEPSTLGVAETRPAGASPAVPPAPPGAAPLPLGHLEREPQDGGRRSAPKRLEVWRRAPLHFPMLALRPSVGSESLGLGTRPAHEYAGPRWSVHGRGTPGNRIPAPRHAGTDIGLEPCCAPSRFAHGSACSQRTRLRLTSSLGSAVRPRTRSRSPVRTELCEECAFRLLRTVKNHRLWQLQVGAEESAFEESRRG